MGGSLPLAMQLVYFSDIPHRHRLGAFGRGWTHCWDKGLTVKEDGTVVIQSGGTNYAFQPDTRGGFLPPENYAAKLQLSGETYTLSEYVSGLSFAFTGGFLITVTDAHGNDISLTYDGGRLSSLQNNDGQSIALTYDGNGRVA